MRYRSFIKISCLFFLSIIKSYALDINRSGEIILGGEVFGSGDVVRINVSNVSLNLNGNVVTDGMKGIVVAEGLSNIIIKNGVVKDNKIGISIGQNCSNITLKNVDIINCSDRAIEVLGTRSNGISNVEMSKIKIENCCTVGIADHIIHIEYGEDVIMRNLRISKSGTSSIAIRAFNILNSTKFLIENISIIGNNGLSFEGFHIEKSTDVFLNFCDIRVNSVTNNFTGILFTGKSTVSNNCRSCIISDNSSINGPFSGIEVQANVERTILVDCISSNNKTMGVVATAHCFGFNFDQCLNCSIKGCQAIFNRALGNGITNIAAGFNIGSSAGGITGVKNCEFIKNEAHRNNGFNDLTSFGFRVVSQVGGNENNLFQSNIASRNGRVAFLEMNQIVPDTGKGSSAGGVPKGSITNLSFLKLNKQVGALSNVGII